MCSLMSRRFLRRSLIEMPDDGRAPASCGAVAGSCRRRLEIGDALAQHGDEIAHDVRDRMIDAEEVGVKVALGDAQANLPVEARC